MLENIFSLFLSGYGTMLKQVQLQTGFKSVFKSIFNSVFALCQCMTLTKSFVLRFNRKISLTDVESELYFKDRSFDVKAEMLAYRRRSLILSVL